MRNIAANTFLVFGSLLVGLAASEMLLRTMTNFPISEISHSISHPLLNYVLDPRSNDVDQDGFRNPGAATAISIAAIGDSHTYGYNVFSADSWPQQYAGLIGAPVYNYGVPGYSVLEYYELIEMAMSKGFSSIIIALFPQNDFVSCHDVNPNNIRKYHVKAICDYREMVRRQRPVEEVKHFLKANVALLGAFDYWIWDRAGRHEAWADPESPWFMDLENDVIKARVDEFLSKMKEYRLSAARRGVKIYVVLIPSKPRMDVALSQRQSVELSDAFRAYAAKEQDLSSYIVSELQGIGYCATDLSRPLLDHYSDTLQAGQKFYPTAPGFGNSNDHPLEAGYLAYAETIRESLSSCR